MFTLLRSVQRESSPAPSFPQFSFKYVGCKIHLRSSVINLNAHADSIEESLSSSQNSPKIDPYPYPPHSRPALTGTGTRINPCGLPDSRVAVESAGALQGHFPVHRVTDSRAVATCTRSHPRLSHSRTIYPSSVCTPPSYLSPPSSSDVHRPSLG